MRAIAYGSRYSLPVAHAMHCLWLTLLTACGSHAFHCFPLWQGGQQAIVSVALNLSFQTRHSAAICIFDEIDAALDTQRTQAL